MGRDPQTNFGPAQADLFAYGQASLTIGQRVRVRSSDGTTVTGMAVGVDAEGRLLVDSGASVRVVSAGDVEHVRPSAAG